MDNQAAAAANNPNDANATALPPGVNPQVAAVAAPIFALSAARVNPNNFIDYSTSAGQKLFSKVTTYLEYTFDVEEESIQTFIETLSNRAVMAGWNSGASSILTISQKIYFPSTAPSHYKKLEMML